MLSVWHNNKVLYAIIVSDTIYMVDILPWE